MRFSQRRGLSPVRVEIQRESIDDALRNKLWSGIKIAFFDRIESQYVLHQRSEDVAKRVFIHFFRLPVDKTPNQWLITEAFVRKWFFEAQWFELFDLIETLVAELNDIDSPERLSALLNAFLEQELSAYRLVSGQVVEITSAEEIAAIETALKDTDRLAAVHQHLRVALEKLSDRKNPDYRNCIKESISAVEAAAQLITAEAKVTLGQAIGRLEEAGLDVHPALRDAWKKLYGWTSDAAGIRHALTEGDAAKAIPAAQARYMLVSCSAFVSYLIDEARRVGAIP